MFGLQPGDRVHVVQTWDYGPPANPRMSYVVESVCDGGRSVCLWGQRAALPATCLRKVEMLTPSIQVWEVHAYALMGCGLLYPYEWEEFKALQRFRILQLGGYDD
jgi:hypothetical protein